MVIQVNKSIKLTPIFKKDKNQLIERINHPEIANNTLTIPYPYKKEDAEWFFGHLAQKKKEHPDQIFTWAIRHSDDGLIGSIGLVGGVALGNPNRDAFGYWLWEKYWRQGIMTQVVKKFSEYCFHERGLVRLEASVFEHNKGSIGVLKKAGFEQEGYLKKAFYKNEAYLNAYLFAKTN